MVDMIDSGEYESRTGMATPAELIETPIFQGRVISSLYQSLTPSFNGKRCISAEIASQRQIFDLNGRIPPSIRSLKWLLPTLILHTPWGKGLHVNTKQMIIDNSPDILLPMSVMENGPPES